MYWGETAEFNETFKYLKNGKVTQLIKGSPLKIETWGHCVIYTDVN